MLKHQLGLFGQVHGAGLASVLVQALLGHIQLAPELGHLLLEEGQDLAGFLGPALDVLMHILGDDLVEDFSAMDRAAVA